MQFGGEAGNPAYVTRSRSGAVFSSFIPGCLPIFSGHTRATRGSCLRVPGSGIIGWPWEPQVDATGKGGWEGYNWLGLGLLIDIGQWSGSGYRHRGRLGYRR